MSAYDVDVAWREELTRERDEARAELANQKQVSADWKRLFLEVQAAESALQADNARLRAALGALRSKPGLPYGTTAILDATLAASPSDTLDALRELMASATIEGIGSPDMQRVINNPRLAWLRGT